MTFLGQDRQQQNGGREHRRHDRQPDVVSDLRQTEKNEHLAHVDRIATEAERALGDEPVGGFVGKEGGARADQRENAPRRQGRAGKAQRIAGQPGGAVVDHASPELRSIRDRLRKQRTRLKGTLESYLRGKDTSKYLQDQVVTERNGRYVLIVRAEHRTSIPGIVHGASTSGASLFLEPLSTVEINNDIVALEQQEAEEVRRILLSLSDAFRRRAADLHRTVDASTELDVLQARASFSSLIDGQEPAIAADGRLELRAARHPLLIPAVRRHLGESAAQSVILMAIVIGLTVVQFRYIERRVVY